MENIGNVIAAKFFSGCYDVRDVSIGPNVKKNLDKLINNLLAESDLDCAWGPSTPLADGSGSSKVRHAPLIFPILTIHC